MARHAAQLLFASGARAFGSPSPSLLAVIASSSFFIPLFASIILASLSHPLSPCRDMPGVVSSNMLVVLSDRIAPDVLAVDVRKQLYQLAVEARRRKTPSSDPEFFARPTGRFAGLSSTASIVDRILQGVDRDNPQGGGVVFTLMRLGLKEVELPAMGVTTIEQLRKIARI